MNDPLEVGGYPDPNGEHQERARRELVIDISKGDASVVAARVRRKRQSLESPVRKQRRGHVGRPALVGEGPEEAGAVDDRLRDRV